MEQGCLEFGDALVLFLSANSEEFVAATGGVLLLVGRGWYRRLQALRDAAILTSFAAAVISTDPTDPDLQHRESLGLLAVSGLPSDAPLIQALRQLAPRPQLDHLTPVRPPLSTGNGPDLEPEQMLRLLMGRGLSRREAEIASLAGQGLGNGEIAQQLFLSETTVKGHLRRAYRKLDVVRRSGLLALLQ